MAFDMMCRGRSRGREQEVLCPPLQDATSFIVAFKMCLPLAHQSVIPFLSGGPLLRKILDPHLEWSKFLGGVERVLVTSYCRSDSKARVRL